ncbi:MAG: 3-oxoacyl-[acyl-carrier-protein] reductase [Candidatus Omnitrophota bacterium]
MQLKDKVAIITGGARGIGREIAVLFAREGANIVIADLNKEIMENVRKDIESMGRTVLDLVIDVTKLSEVEDMMNKTIDKFKKIDILINNAGITRDNLIIRMSEAEWDTVLAVNLKGSFNCIKMVSRQMMKQRSGKIISISSVIGLIGNAGQVNYAASKAGIIGLTKSAAKELSSRNINVNAVAPGFIQTEMTAKLPEELKNQMRSLIPLNKFGEAMDVAKLALFLASDASSYITGQVINVDGGMVM